MNKTSETEIWKTIVDKNLVELPYQISNLARIRNSDHKILSTKQVGTRYIRAKLGKCTFAVHRLVAEAFLENPHNLPCVHHKDSNVSNNVLDNLEWVTYVENSAYANENRPSQRYKSTSIEAFDENNERIVYESISEVVRQYRLSPYTVKSLVAENEAVYVKNKEGKVVYVHFKYIQATRDGDWVQAQYTKCDHLEVSRKGEIWSKKTKRILTPNADKNGYFRINVGVGKVAVHHIICSTFHGAKPSEKHVVNHINHNKNDNSAENLEWCLATENATRFHEHLRNNNIERTTAGMTPIYQFELDGKFIRSFASQAIATRYFENRDISGDIAGTLVDKKCSNYCPTAFGYQWKLARDFAKNEQPMMNECEELTRKFPDIKFYWNQVNFDFIRKCINNRTLVPIVKIDLDGTRISVYNSIEELVSANYGTAGNISQAIRENDGSGGLYNGYVVRKATYADMADLPYEKVIPTAVRKKFSSSELIDFTKPLDCEIMRGALMSVDAEPRSKIGYQMIGTPIWQIDCDTGGRLKKWPTIAGTEKTMGYGRNSISQIMKGRGIACGTSEKQNKFMWELATFNLETDPYERISYDEKRKRRKLEQRS